MYAVKISGTQTVFGFMFTQIKTTFKIVTKMCIADIYTLLHLVHAETMKRSLMSRFKCRRVDVTQNLNGVERAQKLSCLPAHGKKCSEFVGNP